MPLRHTLTKSNSSLSSGHFWFLLACLIPPLAGLKTLSTLFTLAWNDDRYTHILFVPLVAAALIFLRRQVIFRHPAQRLVPTLFVALVGVAAVWVTPPQPAAFAAVLVLSWLSIFLTFYGSAPFRAALFPLALLCLLIPLPPQLVLSAQTALQHGSADLAELLFNLAGTPVLRQGLVFSLPGFDIEIARECSGLRSTTALLITSLVLSYLFLRSGKRRLLFILFTIAVAIFKNALRITTLSWLALHVSRHYLFSDAHRYGGIPASAFALGLLVPALLLLQRAEFPRPVGAPPSPAPPASSPEV